MSLTDSVFGKPLATSEERAEHIGVAAGIPIFGLDALTSAAYGPEAAMTLLIPLGLPGSSTYRAGNFGDPDSAGDRVLQLPADDCGVSAGGGGSYTVATENLGDGRGAAGGGGADDRLHFDGGGGNLGWRDGADVGCADLAPHTLAICLVILVILAVVNMRGVKDTGAAFILPTFLFVGTLLALIGVGVYRAYLSGGHPMPLVAPPPALPATVKYLGMWLLMKTFASGCAAMTGVEAVSNGVMAFGEPRSKNAQRTLTMIVVTLMVLLFGIAYLAKAYGVMAMEPEAKGYQSVLSILVTAVFGRGWFYYLTMGVGAAGAGAEREYGVCGFSAAGAGDCDA